MRYFLTIFLVLTAAHSESIETKQIEIEGNGEKNFEFYVLDNSGKQIYQFDNSEFVIIEDNDTIKNYEINCSKEIEKPQISSYLMIDNSGSMAGSGIQIAKGSALSWIENLESSESNYECAIGEFNDYARHKRNLTNNKNLLKVAVNTIVPGGGTNFNEAFLGYSGSIENLKTASNNKVLIFLTDGFSNVDFEKVIRKANEFDITIYCLVIGQGVPGSLYDISKSTGGLSFGNINSVQQAKEIYNSIFKRSKKEVSYCNLKWKSKNLCGDTKIYYNNKEIFINYSPNARLKRPYIASNTQIIDLGSYENLSTLDTVITITAVNDDLEINELIYDQDKITISKRLKYPIVIEENTNLDIPISISKNEYLFQSDILIKTNCDDYSVTILGGTRDPKLPPQKRWGFGTTSLLTDIGQTRFPDYKGLNGGIGLQLYLSRVFALRLSYGFISTINKPSINDIISDQEFSRIASANLRINLSSNDNSIFYIAPGLVYQDYYNLPEYNDGWKIFNGDYSISMNLPIGAEWFFADNMSLSLQYELDLTRYFTKEGKIKSQSEFDDHFHGSSISISQLPTITLSYFIN